MAASTGIVLNALLLLAAASVVLLRSTRGKYWGPEGPIGAWLLYLPPLFLFALVLAVTIGTGRFDWIAGGRPDTGLRSLIGVTPWIMLAGCFLALNPCPSPGMLPKIPMAATLGATALAGWLVTAAGAVNYVSQQDEMEASHVEHAAAFDRQLADEFRAPGTDAPL